jgi:hypothetical protein
VDGLVFGRSRGDCRAPERGDQRERFHISFGTYFYFTGWCKHISTNVAAVKVEAAQENWPAFCPRCPECGRDWSRRSRRNIYLANHGYRESAAQDDIGEKLIMSGRHSVSAI